MRCTLGVGNWRLTLSTCEQCGATFYDAAAAWGGHLCGHCIADRIELLLMNQTLEVLRKPMRRATSEEIEVGVLAQAAHEQRRSA